MHTIDELAHITGMPSRTIRFYNTQGLLPPPMMQGRVAYYDDEHVVVLNIIKELKEQQNLPLETIRQMLTIRAKQGEVQMNLALKQRLLRPLTAGGQDIRLTREALMRQTGATAERIDELTVFNCANWCAAKSPLLSSMCNHAGAKRACRLSSRPSNLRRS